MDAEAAAEDYRSSLTDLVTNSKPLISMLTMLAEENQKFAQHIVQVIETHIQKVKPVEKLPALYLVDSILKNARESQYVSLFTQNIVNVFCHVFEQVDEKTRQAMYKLRHTWNDIFPQRKLYALDVRVSHIDPAWPVTAVPTEVLTAPSPSIHVNPRFLSTTRPSADEPAPATRSQPDSDEVKRQLMAKQEELFKLKKQTIDLQLAQAKAQVEKLEKLKQQPSTVSAPVTLAMLRKTEELQDPRLNRQKDMSLKDQRSASVASNLVHPSISAEKGDSSNVQAHNSALANDGGSKHAGLPNNQRETGLQQGRLSTLAPSNVVGWNHPSAATPGKADEVLQGDGRNKRPLADPRLAPIADAKKQTSEPTVGRLPNGPTKAHIGVGVSKRISPIRDAAPIVSCDMNSMDKDERLSERDFKRERGERVVPTNDKPQPTVKPGSRTARVNKGLERSDPRLEGQPASDPQPPQRELREDKEDHMQAHSVRSLPKGKVVPGSIIRDPSGSEIYGSRDRNHKMPALQDRDERVARVGQVSESGKSGNFDVDMRVESSKIKDATRDEVKKERRDEPKAVKRPKGAELKTATTRAGSKGTGSKPQVEASGDSGGNGITKRRQVTSGPAIPRGPLTGNAAHGASQQVAATEGVDAVDRDERIKPGFLDNLDKDDRIKDVKRSPIMAMKIPKKQQPSERTYRQRGGANEPLHHGSPDNLHRPRSRSPRQRVPLSAVSSGSSGHGHGDMDMRQRRTPPTSQLIDQQPVKAAFPSSDVSQGEDIDLRKMQPSASLLKSKPVHADIMVCDDVDLRTQARKRRAAQENVDEELPSMKKGHWSGEEDDDDDEHEDVRDLFGAEDQDYRQQSGGPPPASPAAHTGWTAFKENHPRVFPYNARHRIRGPDGDVDLRQQQSSYRSPLLRPPQQQTLSHHGRSPLLSEPPVQQDQMQLLRDTQSLRSRAEWRFQNGHISREDYQDALAQLDELQRMRPPHAHSEWLDANGRLSPAITAGVSAQRYGGCDGPPLDPQFRQGAAPHSRGQLSPGERSRAWDWQQPREGGFPPQQPREGGFPPQQSREGGFPPQQPREGGFPPQQPREGGFPAQQPREGGFPPQQPREGGFPPQQPREGGFPPQQSREGGFPPQQSREGGFPPQQPREGGFPPQQHREGGFPPQQPREGGFPPQQPREAGSFMRQQHDGGSFATQQQGGGFAPQQQHDGGGSFTSQQQGIGGFALPQQGGGSFAPQQQGVGGFTPPQQTGVFPPQSIGFVPLQQGGFASQQQSGSFPPLQGGGFVAQNQGGGFAPQQQAVGGFVTRHPYLHEQVGVPRYGSTQSVVDEDHEQTHTAGRHATPAFHTLHGQAQRPRYGESQSEVVIDGKPYELTLGLKPRYISIGGRKWMVRADKDTREILIDEQCYYRLGDPIREFMLAQQPHRIYFLGPRRHMWVDGLQYDVRVDAPPQTLMIGGRPHVVHIESHTNKLFIDGDDKGDCSCGPIDVDLGGKMHQVSFEPPPKRIMIDGKLCELNFDGPLPVIVIDGRMHGIRFDGPPREILIDNVPYMVRMDQPQRIKLGRRAHSLAFGGPGHEVMIDGKQYEVIFDGPPREVNIGGSSHMVRLVGDPPGVKILGEVVPGEMRAGVASMVTPLPPLLRMPASLPPLYGAPPPPHGMMLPMLPPPPMWPPLPAAPMRLPMLDVLHPLTAPMGPASMLPIATTMPPPAVAPAPVNVNELFSKLLQYGIISKKEPEVTNISTATHGNLMGMPAAADESMDDVPDLTDLGEEKLKRKHTGVLQRLYVGTQCATCGTRFLSSEAAKYNQHLDWHFRQNKREKEAPKTTLCRKWYFPIDVWVTYEEFTDADESNIFLNNLASSGTTNAAATAVPSESVSCPVATGHEKDDACEICGDPFEQFWDEEEEAWHLKEAIRVKGKTYHPICYEDACETSVMDSSEPISASSSRDSGAVLPVVPVNPKAEMSREPDSIAAAVPGVAGARGTAQAPDTIDLQPTAPVTSAALLSIATIEERVQPNKPTSVQCNKEHPGVAFPANDSQAVLPGSLDNATSLVKVEPAEVTQANDKAEKAAGAPDSTAGDYDEPGTPVQDERVVDDT